MQLTNSLEVASRAISADPNRASTAILYDSDHARVVVFRIDAGQTVPLHSSTSTVILVVASGSGFISGPIDDVVTEWPVIPGMIATFYPGEQHGMRSEFGTLVVIATITPGPGAARAAQTA